MKTLPCLNFINKLKKFLAANKYFPFLEKYENNQTYQYSHRTDKTRTINLTYNWIQEFSFQSVQVTDMIITWSTVKDNYKHIVISLTRPFVGSWGLVCLGSEQNFCCLLMLLSATYTGHILKIYFQTCFAPVIIICIIIFTIIIEIFGSNQLKRIQAIYNVCRYERRGKD